MGTVSHLKKQEVKRNVTETSKDGKEREKEASENTQTTKMPPKKLCLSEAPDSTLVFYSAVLWLLLPSRARCFCSFSEAS